jgi:hypothetical protein
MVRTPGSHPGNRGPIPLGTTNKKAVVIYTPLFLLYAYSFCHINKFFSNQFSVIIMTNIII